MPHQLYYERGSFFEHLSPIAVSSALVPHLRSRRAWGADPSRARGGR